MDLSTFEVILLTCFPNKDNAYNTLIFLGKYLDKKYLIYSETVSNVAEIDLNTDTYQATFYNNPFLLRRVRTCSLKQNIYVSNGSFFKIFCLDDLEPKKIEKAEIEKLFGVEII